MPTPVPLQKALEEMRLLVLLPMAPGEGGTGGRAREILRGGAEGIQLREKAADPARFLQGALEVREACDEEGGIFMVNDRVEAVFPSRADGVHLGQEDLPAAEARRLLGEGVILGVSCHSVDEALRAEDAGADYLALGCIFPSPTKPELEPVGTDLIVQVASKVQLPLMAIGGLGPENIADVFEAGARAAAVSSAALRGPDPESAVRRLREAIPYP